MGQAGTGGSLSEKIMAPRYLPVPYITATVLLIAGSSEEVTDVLGILGRMVLVGHGVG